MKSVLLTLKHEASKVFLTTGEHRPTVYSVPGKYITIKTDLRCGAKIETVLLEGVRVREQLEGERNFHIFYQLCAAGTRGVPGKLVGGSSTYNYLNRSGCHTIAGVEDLEEFNVTAKAMLSIGIDLKEQDLIFGLVHALLHLGNLEFECPRGNSDASQISMNTHDSFLIASEGIGVEGPMLQLALCKTTIQGKASLILKDNNPSAASACRGALAQKLYCFLFLYQAFHMSCFRHEPCLVYVLCLCSK